MEDSARREIEEARENVYGPTNRALADGAQIHGELSNLNPYIEMYAKEVGPHIRNGGWRIGMLVALSVEAGIGQGIRNDLAKNLAKSDKISSRSFAKLAGISDPTVMKYLNSWNLAAAELTGDLAIPSSDELIPGQELTLTEEHTPEVWKKYFKPPAGERERNLLKETERRRDGSNNLEVSDYRDRTFFEGRSDYSLKQVFEANEAWMAYTAQRGTQVRNNLIAVAKEMDYDIDEEN